MKKTKKWGAAAKRRAAQASAPAVAGITLLVWLIGLALGTWWQTNRFVESEQARFAEAFDKAFGLLSQRLDQNEALLDGLVALLRSSRDPAFPALRTYDNEMLKRYPHLYTIGYQPRVALADREAFEGHMGQLLGRPFQIRDFSFDGDRTWQLSPGRPFYFPVTFMAPELENAKDVIGYDVYSDRNFHAAIDRSSQLGDATATLPFDLVEGGRGYIYLRALDQGFSDSDHGTGKIAHLISLLIRVDRLIDGMQAPEGGVLTLRHTAAKVPAAAFLGQTGDAGAAAAETGWAAALPALHLLRQLPSASQPLALDLVARPHWGAFPWREWSAWAVTWALLAGAALVATLTLGRAQRLGGLAQAEIALAREDLTQAQTRAELLRDRSLQELGSAIAHELNQPLAAIAAYSQAALRLTAGSTPPSADTLAQLRETLQANAQQAMRAGELLQRLRNLVAKQPVKRQVVVMQEVVKNALRLEGPRIAAARVEVETVMPPGRVELIGDAMLLEQVLSNLLRNAVEALADSARNPRRIVVELRTEASRCLLGVSDNGPGMSAAQVVQAFEPFHSTKPGGLGIGLVVCATIVQAHGGEISAHKKGGGGAHLVVSLPLSAPAKPSSKPPGAS